ALGTRITVRTGEQVQTAQVGTEGSYLSQHQSDLHFGLGSATQVDELTIYWPDGAVEKNKDIESDRLVIFKHVADYRN
ncbi:MAG: ASPIC/UnbV domain-containing protein, partial [Candidatus Parabeggiatoa sp.]|nr:ASPIC/UnbV domain-containing protein [Candidatus Parabeggiatoa sp.]